MKREIKFRAWFTPREKREGNPRMIYFDNSFRAKIHNGHYLTLASEGLELLEFTGLKDKNGKDIYEGDILRITTDNGYTEIGQIIYKEITARFGFLSPDDSVYGLKTNDWHNEVIGNIYENPELIN